MEKTNQLTPPPRSNTPIIGHILSTYKLWHELLPHIPKASRYTLGEKIDSLLIETIELILVASYAPRENKASLLIKASGKIDLLKVFLQIIWEVRGLDNKQYTALSAKINDLGRMIGGWNKKLI